MAFPGPPAGGTVHAVNADATSKTVQVPAHSAGDMLLLVCGWDGSPTVTVPNIASGEAWTNLATNSNSTNCRLHTAYILDAAGNASTEDIVLTLSASERGTARIYRIPGAHLTTAPVFTNGFSNSADFDAGTALDPSTWATEDTLWIVVFAHDSGAVTVTAAPSSYTGLEDHQIGNAAAGAGFALAYRNNAVASEDPGTWTVTAENHAWALIAVRPAAVGPAQDITPAAVTVNATPGSLGVDLSVTPAATTITVTPGSLALALNVSLTAPTVAVTPGSVTITTAGAQQDITPAAVTVTATPGTLGVAQGITPAAVTVTATPGSLSLALSVALTGPTVTATPGSLSVAQGITPALVTVTATPGSLALSLRVTPAAVTVTATPGALSVALSVAPQAVTVTATPGSLSVTQTLGLALTGPTVAVTPGSLLVSTTGKTVVGSGGPAAVGTAAGSTRSRSVVGS